MVNTGIGLQLLPTIHIAAAPVPPWLAGAGLGVVAATMLAGTPATAQTTPTTVELTNGNSSLNVDLGRFSTEEFWLVDGVDYLYSEIIFLNLGSDPDQGEVPLSEFDLLFAESTANTYSASFSGFGGQLNLQIDYTLLGGEPGSNSASRNSVITLFNPTDTALDYTLTTYIDLDLVLDKAFDNDTTTFSPADNTLTQVDPTGVEISLILGQTPTAVQIEEFPNLLVELFDDSRTVLTPTTTASTGDATVAMQFDGSLASGESLTFSLITQVDNQAAAHAVPEPGIVVALSAVGLTLLGWRRR